MNKLKIMQKKLGVLAAIVVAVIGVAAGIMLFTGSMATEAATRKTTAESNLASDRSKLDGMKTQLSQADDAEKRFSEILMQHPNDDFSADSDELKAWLRAAKDAYRFADNSFKLTMPLEKTSEKQGLPTVGFDIVERPAMKLELEAISDVHVYSFLQSLRSNASGMIRITKFSIERVLDMDTATFRQLLTGQNPSLVKSSMEFTWIGIREKKAPKEGEAASGAVTDPSMGGMQ